MSTALDKLRQSAWINVLVFLGYLVLAVVMTWPLVTRLGTELAGEGTDVWIHQWTFWWIKQALANGLNPFYTTLLYYPEGVSLTSHNIAWFNIALWLPLQAFLGSIAAYNIVFLLVLALNGFALYLLAKAETRIVVAAILGGVIFEFWPYTFSHNDHPNMMVTFWVPLTMYFMLRTFRDGRVLDAVLTGVSLALIGITRWQLLVMSAPILLAYGLYLFYRESSARTGRTAGLLLLSLGLGALLMTPLAMPLVLDQLGRSGPEAVAFEEPDEGATDLLSYVMPPDLYRAVWDNAPDPLPYPQWEPYHRISASAYYVPFIGLVTLALALYGLWRQWSQTWFWLLVALGIMIMALGPELALNGQRYPAVPMPYSALSDSLLDALIRRPHRLNNFLGLPVAMIAAWGVAGITRQIGERSQDRRAGLIIALTALVLGVAILWENPIPPLPTTNTAVPQWYKELANDEEPFAVLEIPFHNRGFDKLYMYYQTIHGKPILVGHVSRLPQDAFTFLDSVPFLEPLQSVYTWNVVEESWVDFDEVDVSRQFDLLADNNVRYIVLNKPLVPAGMLERWRDWVTIKPSYEDDEVVVYATRPQAGQDFEITQKLADGIGLIHSMLAPVEANQEGIVKVDLRWGSSDRPARDYQVCFNLRDEAGQTVETFCYEPVAGWPTSDWEPNDVGRGAYVIPIDEQLEPGSYVVDLVLSTPEGAAPIGETLTLGSIQIVPFAPGESAEGCWEGDLCLRGYDLGQKQDQLDISLYWHAAQTPGQSYKRFVHLVDRENGRVLVQDDAIPRGWTYPTDIWEPDEGVVDRLVLSLDGVPAGAYELRTGWYAVDGGQLLAACPTGDCSSQTADFVTLGPVSLPAGR